MCKVLSTAHKRYADTVYLSLGQVRPSRRRQRQAATDAGPDAAVAAGPPLLPQTPNKLRRRLPLLLHHLHLGPVSDLLIPLLAPPTVSPYVGMSPDYKVRARPRRRPAGGTCAPLSRDGRAASSRPSPPAPAQCDDASVLSRFEEHLVVANALGMLAEHATDEAFSAEHSEAAAQLFLQVFTRLEERPLGERMLKAMVEQGDALQSASRRRPRGWGGWGCAAARARLMSTPGSEVARPLSLTVCSHPPHCYVPAPPRPRSHPAHSDDAWLHVTPALCRAGAGRVRAPTGPRRTRDAGHADHGRVRRRVGSRRRCGRRGPRRRGRGRRRR